MAEKGGEKTEDLNDSISGEFPTDKGDNPPESATGSEDDVQNKKQRFQTPSPRPGTTPFMVQASPPKFVSFDDLMAAANGVRNMSLAHEIAVDTNFKLAKLDSQPSGMEKQVKEIMHKAFWDVFQERISDDPPDFGHALMLIQEVKEKLLSLLLPQHVRLRTQIAEVLDMELIQQKLENDAFDIYYYSDYVLTIMGKLCAPARDNGIAKLRSMKEVVPLFKEMFDVLDLMKMDMANFTIQQMRPYIQKQSVEYERAKFQDFLKAQQDAGVDGLEQTRVWLARSVDRLQPGTDHLQPGTSPREDGAQAGSQANLATPAAILNGAYMELLQWREDWLFPETLVLDSSRFLELCEKTRRLILVTSVLLLTYNTVGSAIQGVQALKLKLKHDVCTLLQDEQKSTLPTVMENIGEQVNKDVNEFLKDHEFGVRDESKQKALIGQIKELSSKDQPVISLMSKRVISFIQQALFSRHVEPLKVPLGMSVMEQELSEICGQFLRLISHNRSVFSAYYTDIIDNLLKRQHYDLSPR